MAKTKKKKKTSDSKSTTMTSLLDEIVSEIDGAQLLGSDELAIKIRGVIPTGDPGIDYGVVGRGGIPLSRLTVAYGMEASGKTTFCLEVVAQCQRLGGVVVYVDSEHKLDPDYAKDLGVDLNSLVIIQPRHLEEFYEMCESVIEKSVNFRENTGEHVPILIVLDSMNALLAKEQIEADYGAKQYAPQATVHSIALPKIIPKISREDVALLFISQVRKKIGVMFGDDDNLSGGSSPKFYASVILKFTKVGTEKDVPKGEKGGNKIAANIRIEAVKNQVFPPFRKLLTQINFGKGFNKGLSLFELATKNDIIQKEGNTFLFDGEKIAVGKNRTVKNLNKDKKFFKKVLKAIKRKKKSKNKKIEEEN
jgi:recombination protein RecA